MEDLMKFEISWKRSSVVPFPNVWHRFETKSKNGKSYSVRIEDIPPERFEEVLDYMGLYYDREESLSAYVRMVDHKTTMSAKRHMRSIVLEQRLGIMAVLDDNHPKPEILGIFLLYVRSKSDPPLKVYVEPWIKIKEIIHALTENLDLFQIFESDIYLSEVGLCVSPQYRGLNLGYSILSSVSKIAKSFGIRGMMTVLTSKWSQSAAEKAGFKLCTEINYDDYKNDKGEVVFAIKSTKSVQCRIINFAETCKEA